MTTSYFTTVVLAEIADLVAEYEAADAAGKEALAKDMAAAKHGELNGGSILRNDQLHGVGALSAASALVALDIGDGQGLSAGDSARSRAWIPRLPALLAPTPS